MIPHRMLSNEFFANGLKGRVSACRKRLRVKRLTHKAHATNIVDHEPEQVFPETGLAVASILDDYTVGGSSNSSECSAEFASSDTRKGKVSPPPDKHEVGIT
jgi:hypothetical protein